MYICMSGSAYLRVGDIIDGTVCYRGCDKRICCMLTGRRATAKAGDGHKSQVLSRCCLLSYGRAGGNASLMLLVYLHVIGIVMYT